MRGIPQQETRVVAVVTLVTAEELFEMTEDFRGELIDGVLIEMPPPAPLHGRTVQKVGVALGRLEENGVGVALGEMGVILRRTPDTVRAPDAAFMRKDRVPPTGFPARYWDIAPDVVIEVVSPSNTPAELQARIRDWLEAGVRLVLVVYPEPRTVEAIRSLQDRRRLAINDILDASDVLTGFSFPIAQLFD